MLYSRTLLKPSRRAFQTGLAVAVAAATLASGTKAQTGTSSPAPSPALAPAPAPAGTAAPSPSISIKVVAPSNTLSPRVLREADDSYLAGARAIEHRDLATAEKRFERAVALNPNNRDYALALAVTREHRLTELVQGAAKAQMHGDTAQADTLLTQARVLDPENSVVMQHFGPAGLLAETSATSSLPAVDIASTLAGPPELAPSPDRQSFHRRGGVQELLRTVYSAYGLSLILDPAVNSSTSLRLDLDDVDFPTASGVLFTMAHLFAVPLDSKHALIAPDTPDNRARLSPLIEETVFLPGTPSEVLNELANLARNVFDLKQTVISSAGGSLLIRGDAGSLKLLNATYANMLDGGSDVLIDVKLYELDKTRTRDIGAVPPSSAGIFSIAAEAQTLVGANQTLINTAIANGVLTLTGNPLTDLIREVGFLVASGAVSATQYTNLLGTVGGGLSLAGVFLGSNASFNLLLNSSDVRLLDAVQLRAGDRQPASFRSGTRYPVVTSIYSSGIGSSLSSSLAGLSVNGTSVGSLLSQYLGTSSVTVPQIQYEELGLTLKTTPQILRDGSVALQLDMKLEALAGTSINTLPVLNSRALTSSVTVPAGSTAMLVSEVSSSEARSVQGLPGLSELPGFQGTDKSSTRNTGELLITITPHVVRRGDLHIASRALAVGRETGATVE